MMIPFPANSPVVPVDCVNTTPAIGALCIDGTYYVGTITIGGDTYKLATTPGNCGYESGGSASTSPTSDFTSTCSGGNDTMAKEATSFPWNALSVDKTDGTWTARSSVKGSTTTSLIMGSYPSSPAFAYCHYLNYAGFTDWFLPNRSELHMMACHGTTSAYPLPGSNSDDVNCFTFGYGSGAGVVPGLLSGKNSPAAGFVNYHSSTTMTWGGSANVRETTINGDFSGTQDIGGAGAAYLVRCVRIIN